MFGSSRKSMRVLRRKALTGLQAAGSDSRWKEDVVVLARGRSKVGWSGLAAVKMVRARTGCLGVKAGREEYEKDLAIVPECCEAQLAPDDPLNRFAMPAPLSRTQPRRTEHDAHFRTTANRVPAGADQADARQCKKAYDTSGKGRWIASNTNSPNAEDARPSRVQDSCEAACARGG